ncbi:MAG TPA: cyclase family protein [Solirubrobacterales bacterium]|jgi:kynurenine formamidase|nr:cyclase family protein [Solirubrobacterales bacterium]
MTVATGWLWDLLVQLRDARFIDLTHTFEPGIPHAEDMPDESSRLIYDFDTDGFRAHVYEFAGQWGTHMDPPSHYIRDGDSIDAIPVAKMLLPLVVLDIRDKVAENPDYAAEVADIEAWESRNGRLPAGCFVALRSGWSERWPSGASMHNKDAAGVSHFPGWGLELMRFLVEEREIAACGHETTDTDPGRLVSADEFPAETYVLEQGRYQVEMLASLDQVPQAGSIISCTAPKPRGGSGFPARAFAIVPEPAGD